MRSKVTLCLLFLLVVVVNASDRSQEVDDEIRHFVREATAHLLGTFDFSSKVLYSDDGKEGEVETSGDKEQTTEAQESTTAATESESSSSEPSPPGPPEEVSIDSMNSTFTSFFYRQRHRAFDAERNETRRAVLEQYFRAFGLETAIQEFTVRGETGQNLIGVMPGRYRGSIDDSIVIIAAHYDTVEECPGVDDNGAGSVAVLEAARVLSPYRNMLNSTLYFVLFDLEERGLWGSILFVREYLVPFELTQRGVTVVGAYVADMILTYDRQANSQRIPSDVATVTTCF